MPVEPPAPTWPFPPAGAADADGLVHVGGDLEPGTLLAAYRSGLFPMPVRAGLGWWSPDPRGVLPLDGLRVSRSLRKACARFVVRVDTAFDAVLDACADPARSPRWITDEVKDAYVRLHRLGWAHSVEAWTPDGELAGGLYGVAVGGMFGGESMFSRQPDASKVALVALVEGLRDGGGLVVDVQWVTPHLASLGAVAVPRRAYLDLLAEAVARPLPPFLAAAAP